jgi:hypothetical protein
MVELGRHSVSGWIIAPSVLVPSDGVFGRFDLLVALCGCHTMFVCLYCTAPNPCFLFILGHLRDAYCRLTGAGLNDSTSGHKPYKLKLCCLWVALAPPVPTVMVSIGNLVIWYL